MRLFLLVPFLVALIALLVWLTQIVWNAVVPDVFSGMHTITFVQSGLLMILSSLLVRSWAPRK